MSPEFVSKWEHILEDVEKSRVPIQFVKKIIVRMMGKKQVTINIQTLLKQGLEPEEIEEVVGRRLEELDPLITSFEFVLNLETIAQTVQPATDNLLKNL